MKKIFLSYFVIFTTILLAQTEIPKSYSNLRYSGDTLILRWQDSDLRQLKEHAQYKYSEIVINPEGYKRGLKYDFKNTKLNGTMYYGFINDKDGSFEYPVFFNRPTSIKNGVAKIDISIMSGKYDMINWEFNKKGTIGYRIVNEKGYIIYDGRINFKYSGTSFTSEPTIIEGPFLSKLKDTEVTIWYKTNYKVKTTITINKTDFTDEKESFFHSFTIKDLESAKRYNYIVKCKDFYYEYHLTTAPEKGAKTPFTFAYASDSRTGQGGGERDIFGVNAYIVKKISALAIKENVAFMQFSGDLIDGYSNSIDQINLQYANWKKSVEPYGHYIPIYVAQGNHEALINTFSIMGLRSTIGIDKFPFNSSSSEAIFANNFVLPENGLATEDGNKYDPSKETIDFPPYNETVYHYTYGNTAIIVLNSNYWYATLLDRVTATSGNMHAYIMDNQLKWLEKTILDFENDDKIDNVFVTLHTPVFPNGGHAYNDMWYNGNNNIRPIIAGKPVDKGIIERRDEFLDITINKSTKVVALLTGDEHNYCKLLINDKMKRYPKKYDKKELKLNRILYQINNGAAGAPYYAQEELPWSEFASGFTTQHAVVLIDVDGTKINIRVINPDTLEEIEHFKLK